MGENFLTEEELSMCLYCISWFEADENKFMEGMQTFFDVIHARVEEELPHLSEDWDIIGYFETMEDYYKASTDYRRK